MKLSKLIYKTFGIKTRKQRQFDKTLIKLGIAYLNELKSNTKFMNYVNNSNPTLKRRTENILYKNK